MDRYFFSKLAVLFNGVDIPLEDKIEHLKAIEAVKNEYAIVFEPVLHKEAIKFNKLLGNTPAIFKCRARGMRVSPGTVTNYGDGKLNKIN